MVQCSHSAGRVKGTYLKDKYHKLKTRRGAKRAAVAIGHKILVIAYHLIKNQEPYKELGETYLDTRNKARILKHYQHRIEALGFTVSLTEKAA